MTITFFLKPHYRRSFGWHPSAPKLPGKKKKKKKVYKIVEGPELKAEEVDFKDMATDLDREVKVRRKRRRSIKLYSLYKWLFGDD